MTRTGLIPAIALCILAACTRKGAESSPPPDTCVAAQAAPRGATVVLPGVATVRFPEGAFRAPQRVSVCATSSPETRRDFRITAEEALGAQRVLPREVRINTGTVAPAGAAMEVVLPTGSMQSPQQSPHTGGGLRPFVQFWQEGGEEILDSFEAIPHTYDPAANTLSFDLPAGSFTARRRRDRSYEAVVVVGRLPAT